MISSIMRVAACRVKYAQTTQLKAMILPPIHFYKGVTISSTVKDGLTRNFG